MGGLSLTINTWQQTDIFLAKAFRNTEVLCLFLFYLEMQTFCGQSKTWNHFEFWSLSLGLLLCLIKESTVLLTISGFSQSPS